MPIIFLKYCIRKLISTGAGISWMIVYLRSNEERIDLHVFSIHAGRIMRGKACSRQESSAEKMRLQSILKLTMRKSLFILPLFFLFACNSPDDAGTPCNYTIDTVGATIVRMDSTNTPYPDIVLAIPSKISGTDTIRYTNNTNESPTWEVATARGYQTGARLKCIRHFRTSGACTPEFFQVKKELFRQR